MDVRAKLDIDLEDTITGGVKRIGFNDGRTLDVTIPKGAADGQTLRLKGQGQQGRGGAFGDALIELKVRPHPVFKREGADLTMDLPVSVPDAVLGGKVEAPTPDGLVSLNVPKGANSGRGAEAEGQGRLRRQRRLTGRSDGPAHGHAAGQARRRARKVRRDLAQGPALYAPPEGADVCG